MGEQCKHENVAVEFDLEAAKNLTPREIRMKYPRFDGTCPDCKQHVIIYASHAHYIYGDY